MMLKIKSSIFALLTSCILSTTVGAQSNGYFSMYNTDKPGFAYGFAANILRLDGSKEHLKDFTVAAQFTARNGSGVDAWAFGAAIEAWALPGSRSILIGLESSVINEEPTNFYPKIAHNSVFKNRADDVPANPNQPMNENSIAYWVSAQVGTGFQRGLVFDTNSLYDSRGRSAAIDLSDISDEIISNVDLIRIRKNVSLRYDPTKKQLVLHVTEN